MTREEAIHRLKNTAWLGTNKDREETEQAVDMAIEALSANDGLRCALAGGRKCFAQGYDFTWCITCPHISEEDRQLVNHAVLALPSADAVSRETHYDAVANRITDMEERGFVSVVRCKDCRHHGMRDCPVWEDCTTEDYMWCYYGERREP